MSPADTVNELIASLKELARQYDALGTKKPGYFDGYVDGLNFAIAKFTAIRFELRMDETQQKIMEKMYPKGGDPSQNGAKADDKRS